MYLWPLLFQHTSKNIRKYMGASFKIIIFTHMDFMFCQFGKRRAPQNDEDPSNIISKFMDMRPISIKKHEWIFANMVDQKILAYHRVFMEKEFKIVDSWNSWKSGNSKNDFFEKVEA